MLARHEYAIGKGTLKHMGETEVREIWIEGQQAGPSLPNSEDCGDGFEVMRDDEANHILERYTGGSQTPGDCIGAAVQLRVGYLPVWRAWIFRHTGEGHGVRLPSRDLFKALRDQVTRNCVPRLDIRELWQLGGWRRNLGGARHVDIHLKGSRSRE